MTAPIASGSSSAAFLLRGVDDVPHGEDLDEVRAWADRRFDFGTGAVDPREFDEIVATDGWTEIVETSRFWADDAMSRGRGAAAAATALALLGVPVVWTARFEPGRGLSVRVGADALNRQAITAAIGAAFPGIRLARSEALAHHGQRVALSCRPAIASGHSLHLAEVSFGPALLDRLLALDAVPWEVQVVLAPLGADALARRRDALIELGRRLDGQRTAQVQTDALTTRSIENGEVARLLESISDEHTRLDELLDRGAFAMAARVLAPDAGSLIAAAAAVLSAGSGVRARWRVSGPGDAPLPVSIVSADEVADVLAPPDRDVHGLPSTAWFAIDEHPEPPAPDARVLSLGTTRRGAALDVDVERLTSHLLVTGMTGAGKSTAIAALLRQLSDLDVPWLVIEPVKREYESLDLSGVRVWRPGCPNPGERWFLNPLAVPPGASVSEHADRMVAVFRGALGLPDPLPSLMQTALVDVYRRAGWDLRSDAHIAEGHRQLWPTLRDLLAVAKGLPVLDDYDAATRGNIRAALDARIGGLIAGPRGTTLLGPDDGSADELVGGPVVVNLDAIPDPYARAFIAHCILIRIVEHRRVRPSRHLAHITVIEEAHTLLASGPPQEAGGASSDRHVAEALGDLLAEVRSTGEGLIVVDQSASRLERSAIRNTGTKVCFRVVDPDDQEVLAGALAIGAADLGVFAGLQDHEALVMWPGMDTPVRGMIRAEYVAHRPPVGPDPQHACTITSPEVAAAADSLIRLRGDAASVLRRALVQRTRQLHESVTDVTIRSIDDAAIEEAVFELGRSRGWTTERTARALDAVLDHREDEDHPTALLDAATQPFGACSAVCHEGGCRWMEPAAVQARRVRALGPTAVNRLVADREELRRRIERRAVAVLPGLDADNSVDALRIRQCITVQTFDEDFDRDTVAAMVTAVWGGA